MTKEVKKNKRAVVDGDNGAAQQLQPQQAPVVTAVIATAVKPPLAPAARARRKRGTGDPSKYYFTSDTQAAIVEWQQSPDRVHRDEVYLKRIHPAFEKLVENLISIYRFTALHETSLELRSDCIAFLFETISKFDNSRGTNAFSYFNVVAKRWLIVRSKQRSHKTRVMISMDEEGSMTSQDSAILQSKNVVPSHEDLMHERDVRSKGILMLTEVRDQITNENELKCVNAIIMVYERADDLDLVNKTAIMSYVQEITGLSNKQMSPAMQVIKRLYKTVRADMLNDEDDWATIENDREDNKEVA